MDIPPDAEHLEELAETLWRERHLTELLLYRLVCTRLLLAADEQRYTGIAISEVETVLESLRRAESDRDALVQAVAVTWGTRIDDLSLAALAERAPAPWNGIFAELRSTFLAMTAEIEEAARDNRRLAASGLQQVHETMRALTGGGERATYDAVGRRQGPEVGPALIDQSL